MNASPIAEEYKRFFDAITSGDFDNFALFSTTFDGDPSAVIATVMQDEASGEYIVTPIALMLTTDMLPRLGVPTEDE